LDNGTKVEKLSATLLWRLHALNLRPLPFLEIKENRPPLAGNLSISSGDNGLYLREDELLSQGTWAKDTRSEFIRMAFKSFENSDGVVADERKGSGL
jgi:hypothetical protein